jgi:IcmF-related N-terminal domain
MAKKPQIAKPSIPPVISNVAEAGRPKLPFTARALLTVFKPLIWLIPLAVVAVIAYFFVPDAVKVGKFSIDFKFYSLLLLSVIFGVLVCYVLIRMFRFLAARRRIKKQEELLGKAEALHLQENFHERLQLVRKKLKSSQVGIYDMPWYIVLGDKGSYVHTLLEEQALSFSNRGDLGSLMDAERALDRWVFTNDAVFIDTTGYGRTDANRGAQQAELDAFLNRLMTVRQRCPLNGIVLAVSALELVKGSAKQRKQRAEEILSEIRQIQDFLSIRLPLYLVVTRMECVLGFADYFNDLNQAEGDQIFGWSNPNPPGMRFQSYLFSDVFGGLVENLKQRRFGNLVASTHQNTQLRGGLFPEEFALMKQPLADYIETLFVDNRFTEPPIFRGFFFTGGSEITELATQSCSQYLKEPVLEYITRAVKEETTPRSLFSRDLFSRKIFQEAGVVTRPSKIFHKNLRVKLAAYITAAVLVILLGFHLVTVSRKSARELGDLSADLKAARFVLKTPQPGDDMLSLCMRLDQHKKRLKQSSILSRILGLGRNDEISWHLGAIHRSIFQETSLDAIITETEDRLGHWKGLRSLGDPSFTAFASALSEYTHWSNTYFGMNRNLNLQPFLDFLQVSQKKKYNYLEQFEVFRKEGGRTRKMVSPAWEDNIHQALKTTRVYLRPALREIEHPGGEFTDTEWWVDLAVELQEFNLDYNGLLEIDPPAEDKSHTAMMNRYYDFTGGMFYLLSSRDRMVNLLAEGQQTTVAWVDPDQFYKKMRGSARGLVRLTKILEQDQESVVSDYHTLVAQPIRSLLPVVNMLSPYSGYRWLEDILIGVFGNDQSGSAAGYEVGHKVLNLLDAMQNYDESILALSNGFPDWEATLAKRAPIVQQVKSPVNSPKFGLNQHQLGSKIEELNKMVAPPAQPSTDPAVATQPASSAPQDDEQTAKVLTFWRVSDLTRDMGQWLSVLERRLMFSESRYLEALFQRADFQQGLQDATTWRAIKGHPIFAIGDGITLADKINVFLNQWLAEIPQHIISLVKDTDNAPQYPEMAGFANLIRNVQVLQSAYMPKLRVSMRDFVSCIQALNMDVNKAWQQLRSSPEESPGPGEPVSWQNFLALSAFKKSFEIDRGVVARTITEQLTQIEKHVSITFENELLALYQTDQSQYIERLKKMGIENYFPFKLNGPCMTVEEMLKFFSQLKILNAKFKIVQPAPAPAEKDKSDPSTQTEPAVAPGAARILNALSDNRWNRFYTDCMALESFLFDNRTPRQLKLKVSVVPGDVGQYYHWIRLALGNGTIRDINVYGDPSVDMTLTVPDRTVSLEGLDAAKVSQASLKITKGDFALLKMLYLYGRAENIDRTTWVAEHEMPMAIDPSISIKAKLRFDLEEGLPVLPDVVSIMQ